MEQRRALGLKAHKAHSDTPITDDERIHNGGKQPKKQVHINDDYFLGALTRSGIPLAQLDSAFAVKSFSRLNKLLAKFWKVPQVARK